MSGSAPKKPKSVPKSKSVPKKLRRTKKKTTTRAGGYMTNKKTRRDQLDQAFKY